jgi:hypothetical protein
MRCWMPALLISLFRPEITDCTCSASASRSSGFHDVGDAGQPKEFASSPRDFLGIAPRNERVAAATEVTRGEATTNPFACSGNKTGARLSSMKAVMYNNMICLRRSDRILDSGSSS